MASKEKNSSKLPIINPFNGYLENFYEIDNPIKAVSKIVLEQNIEVFDNELEKFFENNHSVKEWKRKFSSEFSQNIKNYQEYNSNYDKNELNEEIKEIGLIIPNNQYLFHGGLLDLRNDEKRILERPFATSILPSIALFNAIIGSKAYDNGKIELLILLAGTIKTKAIILFQDDLSLSHEVEVLFASGLELTVIGIVRAIENFKVKNAEETKEKEVPVDIVFCNIF